jgi:hypothetical protein
MRAGITYALLTLSLAGCFNKYLLRKKEKQKKIQKQSPDLNEE